MKVNPEEIRVAMDSRLSDIQASDMRRARIRNAVRADSNPRRKRKLTGIVATASLLMVVAAGVALTTGLNLFGIGGNQDTRIGETAHQTALPEQFVATSQAEADVPEPFLSGTGSYFGAPVAVAAKVSTANVEVSVQLRDGEFPVPDEAFWYSTMQRFDNEPGEPKLNGDCWYELTAVDSGGNYLRLESLTRVGAHTITAVFYGTGSLPDTLSVELLLAGGNAAATLVMPVTLTPSDPPVTVGTWAELNAAALAGASEVIVVRNIFFGQEDETIVFSNAVTLRSETGKRYTIDGRGKQILVVQGKNQDTPLKERTTIAGLTFQCGGYSHASTKVFHAEGMAVSVQGPLLAENCSFQNNFMVGAGALAVFGDATLVDCQFKDNRGGNGGGLYAQDADVILSGCTFSKNKGQQGGGIYVFRGSLSIFDSTFSENEAEKDGGAIYATRCEISIEDSVLDGNIAVNNGGAISAYNQSIRLIETQLTQNQAATGGAVYANNASVLLDGGEITANRADDGGGLYAVRSELVLESGTIQDNIASQSGGGIYLQRSTYTVDACEINNNTPDDVTKP